MVVSSDLGGCAEEDVDVGTSGGMVVLLVLHGSPAGRGVRLSSS